MAYYGLCDGGMDNEVIIHQDDFARLCQHHPIETGTYGDSFIRLNHFECYDGFCGIDYATLAHKAREREDRLIASLICLLYMAAAQKDKQDARLIWQKLENTNER